MALKNLLAIAALIVLSAVAWRSCSNDAQREVNSATGEPAQPQAVNADQSSVRANSPASATSPSVPGPKATPAHPLDPAIGLARESLTQILANVDDYTSTLVKRERIGGILGSENKMELKVRARQMAGDSATQPRDSVKRVLDVYIRFTDPWLARGREVIWSQDAKDGKLIAHEGGLKNLSSIRLKPTDQLAMLGNKYPITEIGLARLVEKLIEKAERDKQIGPCQVEFIEHRPVGGVDCQLIQVTHPQRDPRYDFHIAQVYLDRKRMIPLRYAAYLWPATGKTEAPLEEEVTFLNVRLNVGLSDEEFDPQNPQYKFP